MANQLPRSYRILSKLNSSLYFPNNTAHFGPKNNSRYFHSSSVFLARKGFSQTPQIIEVSNKKDKQPVKPQKEPKYANISLAPIPDHKLVEYASDCFEKPAKFIGSVGASFAENVNIKWPNKSLPEIAFLGVSNAGKSTLINSLLNTKGLAKTSKKPGHTKLLNLFEVSGRFVLVDMPGYGYKSRESWGQIVEKYLKEGSFGKGKLKRVFLLIESQRNFKHYDKMIMELLEKYNVPYQIVITKADKLSPCHWEEAYLSPVTSELALFMHKCGHNLACPYLTFISPLKARFGLASLRCQILEATNCIPSKLRHLKMLHL